MVEFELDPEPSGDEELRSAFRWAGVVALLVGFGGLGLTLYWGSTSYWDLARGGETVASALMGSAGAWLVLVSRSSRFSRIRVNDAGIVFVRSSGAGPAFRWEYPGLLVELTDLTRVVSPFRSSSPRPTSHRYWIRVVSGSRTSKAFLPREAFDWIREEAIRIGFVSSGVSRLGEPPDAVSWKLHRPP